MATRAYFAVFISVEFGLVFVERTKRPVAGNATDQQQVVTVDTSRLVVESREDMDAKMPISASS